MPAHHRPKQGLRLVIIIIVFCSGKMIGCLGYSFHHLGRIQASLFCTPRCRQVNVPGACSFNSQFNLCTDCVTFSPSLACPQHVCLRLTSMKLAGLDGAIPHNSLCSLLCLFFFFFFAILFICLNLVRSSPCGAGEIRKALPILLSYPTVVGR